MNEKPSPQDALRLRDVAVVVLFGAALGVLFNALQLGENPSRALAWRKVERTVVALEPVTPAEAATRPPGGAVAAPDSAHASSTAPVKAAPGKGSPAKGAK